MVSRGGRSACRLDLDELLDSRGQTRWPLVAQDAAGCRLVQEALDLGSRGAIELAHELEGHVLEAAMCHLGNQRN